MPWSYYIVYTFIRLVSWFLRLWARWEIRGAENVPRDGALLVVANHMNLVDVPLLAVSLGRKAAFMAKEELFRYKLQSYFWYGAGSFPVRRGRTDLKAMRRAQRVLATGGVLVIFPEGTRSGNGKLQPGLPGSALVALHSGAPILPVGISGTERIRGLASLLRRPRVTVNMGRPFYLPENNNSEKSGKEKRLELTRIVMEHIAELLPPEYRGVYGGPDDS